MKYIKSLSLMYKMYEVVKCKICCHVKACIVKYVTTCKQNLLLFTIQLLYLFKQCNNNVC